MQNAGFIREFSTGSLFFDETKHKDTLKGFLTFLLLCCLLLFTIAQMCHEYDFLLFVTQRLSQPQTSSVRTHVNVTFDDDRKLLSVARSKKGSSWVKVKHRVWEFCVRILSGSLTIDFHCFSCSSPPR